MDRSRVFCEKGNFLNPGKVYGRKFLGGTWIFIAENIPFPLTKMSENIATLGKMAALHSAGRVVVKTVLTGQSA